jgi:nucleoside-diphosphate-sugar epimerase
MMSARFAVTGSSGFIARHLIPKFIDAGASVCGLDLRPCGVDFGNRYWHIIGDIRDPNAVAEMMQGADTVVHLAAEHQDFGVSREQFFDVNVRGMELLLSCSADAGVNDFVFFSSVAVYGRRNEPTHERMIPAPDGPYGASKLQAEALLEQWIEAEPARSALILRPTVVYGEHNHANMYRLMRSISRKRYLQVGAGTNRKSIVYVGNVVSAFFFLLERRRPGICVYNLADEPAMTSRAIAEHLAESLGVGLPGFRIPESAALPMATPLDWIAQVSGRNLPITASRIRKYLANTQHQAVRLRELGFRPQTSQEEALRRTAAWFQSQVRGFGDPRVDEVRSFRDQRS